MTRRWVEREQKVGIIVGTVLRYHLVGETDLVVESSQSHSKGLQRRERKLEIQDKFVIADLAKLYK